MAIGTKSMPSARLRLLKVKRSAPVKVSTPDGGDQQPDARRDDGLELVAVPHGRDQQDAEDSEGGVLRRAKSSAKPATIGAKIVRPMIETVPPMKDPMAAMPSAVPALPFLASASRRRRSPPTTPRPAAAAAPR